MVGFVERSFLSVELVFDDVETWLSGVDIWILDVGL